MATTRKSKTPAKSIAEQKADAEAAVRKMHAAIAVDLDTGADWVRQLKFMQGFRGYSFGNVLLMSFQMEQRRQAVRIVRAMEIGFLGYPVTPEAAPLRLPAAGSVWKAKGGMMRKGEKGLAVLAPIVITPDPTDINPLTGKAKTRCVGFKLQAQTFDIDQIVGVEMPVAPAEEKLTGPGDEVVWTKLAELLTHEGFTLECVPMNDEDADGWTNFTSKIVRIDANMSRAHQVKTLAHEVAHVLMHAPEVRPAFMPRNVMEVEAESVAWTVMDLLGVESDRYSFGYVGGWAKGNGALIASTLERASTHTARIMGWIETGTLEPAKRSGRYEFPEDHALAS